jgi:hypothetical protein
MPTGWLSCGGAGWCLRVDAVPFRKSFGLSLATVTVGWGRRACAVGVALRPA